MNGSNSTVYVLGSGASLLTLTNAEKEFLSTQKVVAMNKYLLFWEKIGVFPTHFFLADIDYPASKVFQESHRVIQLSGRSVHYLLDQSYQTAFNQNWQRFFWHWKTIARKLRRENFLYQPWLKIEHATYFKRLHSFDAPLYWSDSLDDPLFFYRGSLSVLMNLLTLLDLGSEIRLLGVDLNSNISFFQDEIKLRPDLFDTHMREEAIHPLGYHATALPMADGQPGIQAQWQFIVDNLNRCGKRVICCNPNSLLVQNGLCEYRPIFEPVLLSHP
jgi:hypothetical protein